MANALVSTTRNCGFKSHLAHYVVLAIPLFLGLIGCFQSPLEPAVGRTASAADQVSISVAILASSGAAAGDALTVLAKGAREDSAKVSSAAISVLDAAQKGLDAAEIAIIVLAIFIFVNTVATLVAHRIRVQHHYAENPSENPKNK